MSLKSLNCSSSGLNVLYVTNGTNNSLDASNNPNLTCIEVDHINNASSNWPNKDATAIYSFNCP